MHEDPGNAEPWLAHSDPQGVTVVLVRHGRTAWNQERRFLGRTDVPLDEIGRAEAGRVADRLARLPIAAVHTSPLRRAADTAAPLARARGLPPVLQDDLVELAQGELEGHPGSILLERYPDFLAQWVEDPTHARVPGGETLGECQARGLAALQRIGEQSQPGSVVAVVSHQMVISSVLCAALDLPLRMFRLVGHANTAFSVLELREGRLRVRRINEQGHLRSE